MCIETWMEQPPTLPKKSSRRRPGSAMITVDLMYTVMAVSHLMLFGDSKFVFNGNTVTVDSVTFT